MNRCIGRCQAQSLAGQSRQQLKSKIGGPRRVLEIEEAIELRHAIPPASHERDSIRGHERRKAVRIDVPVANMVITGIMDATFLHLKDDFTWIAEKGWELP